MLINFLKPAYSILELGFQLKKKKKAKIFKQRVQKHTNIPC